MGAVKEWAMTHMECPVCGKCFLPWEREINKDSGLTCCSDKCDNDASELFEQIADDQRQGENNGNE